MSADCWECANGQPCKEHPRLTIEEIKAGLDALTNPPATVTPLPRKWRHPTYCAVCGEQIVYRDEKHACTGETKP
jgi:hypothetical protein